MSECTGLIFRFKESSYWNGRGFQHKESLNLLKRKSCTCETCTYIKSDLQELMSTAVDCVYWKKFLNCKCENGDLLRMTILALDEYEFDCRFDKIKK